MLMEKVVERGFEPYFYVLGLEVWLCHEDQE